MSRLIIVDPRPVLIIVAQISSSVTYLRAAKSGRIWSLTERPGGWERWWIRRQPLSCLGTKPSGEQIYGGDGDTATTRLAFRSAASLSCIVGLSKSAEIRFLERINWAGPRSLTACRFEEFRRSVALDPL